MRMRAYVHVRTNIAICILVYWQQTMDMYISATGPCARGECSNAHGVGVEGVGVLL